MDYLPVFLGGMGVFMIAQLGALIWWMSKMSTTLSFIRIDIERMIKAAAKHEEKTEGELKAVWRRIDELSAAK